MKTGQDSPRESRSLSFFFLDHSIFIACTAPPFSMLSEVFVASTLSSAKTPTATLRDVGICVQEFQPSPQLRSTFKKSSTTTNSLAVTPSHIFSAQADKAVVHVYSREKGNQEALVPFPERIRSIAVAGAKYGDMLVLGTEGGRLILWEVRQWIHIFLGLD